MITGGIFKIKNQTRLGLPMLSSRHDLADHRHAVVAEQQGFLRVSLALLTSETFNYMSEL